MALTEQPRTQASLSSKGKAQGPSVILAGVALAVGLVLARPLPGRAEPLLRLRPNPYKATTSRAARRDAVRSIPLDKLDPGGRAKVSSVLSDVSFFRRMPIAVIQCDPDLYLFLVQHPDVVVNIWQLMGITQLAVQQTGATTFQVADSAGTRGSMEYLYQSHDVHLIYTEGAYEGPLFKKPVRGRSVMILKTGYVREPDGRYYITCRLDVFMRVEHAGVELFTKTFQPLVGKVADVNFTQTAGFLGSISRTAESNRRGMQRLAHNLDNVQPDVRERFAQLVEQVARKQVQHDRPAGVQHPLVAIRPPEAGGD
jgi:hypothetical protein